MGTVVLHIHCIQIRLIAHELCKVVLPHTVQFILHYSHIFYVMLSLHYSSCLVWSRVFCCCGGGLIFGVVFSSCLFFVVVVFKRNPKLPYQTHVIKPVLFDTNK